MMTLLAPRMERGGCGDAAAVASHPQNKSGPVGQQVRPHRRLVPHTNTCGCVGTPRSRMCWCCITHAPFGLARVACAAAAAVAGQGPGPCMHRGHAWQATKATATYSCDCSCLPMRVLSTTYAPPASCALRRITVCTAPDRTLPSVMAAFPAGALQPMRPHQCGYNRRRP